MKNVQTQENEQCVYVSRTSSTNSVGNCNKTRNKYKNCNEFVQFLVIRCSAIELHAQNLWGMTGFEPAFPDLKTDQLTAALSLGLPVLRTEGLLQISLQMIEQLSRLCWNDTAVEDYCKDIRGNFTQLISTKCEIYNTHEKTMHIVLCGRMNFSVISVSK